LGTITPEKDSAGRDLKVMIENLIKNPEDYVNNENENVCSDGRRVWIAWSNKAFFDPKGRLIEILSIGNDATERREAEERMLESYKYLGFVNRKISFLLELDRQAEGGRKKEITECVLSSIFNITQAKVGLMYRFEKDEKFHLISSIGVSQKLKKKLRVLGKPNCRVVKTAMQNHLGTQKISKEAAQKCFGFGAKMDYVALLPLRRKMNNKLKGFIYLGFRERKVMDTQETEFCDVFLTHATSALLGSGTLK
jgi:PAS domain-containing protein